MKGFDYENSKKDTLMKMNGLVESFFEDGKLEEKAFYKNGVKQ